MIKPAAIVSIAFFLLLSGCTTVEVTRTTKQKFSKTKPDEVKILKTTPTEPFEEIATVTVSGFKIKETAKMHKELRSKAAAIGAEAVILTSENVDQEEKTFWATGTAIRFE